MNDKIPTKKFKSVFYDLSRIGEWWVLSFGLILLAFITPIYWANHCGSAIGGLTGLFTSPPIYLTLVVVFAAQVFLFASNDYFDRHIDALDKKKRHRNPICTGRVTTKEVWALIAASGTVSLVASLYFGFLTFLFTAFTLFVFYFYTAEPLRFKNKVGLDVLTHGMLINTFPYFFCLIALRDFSTGAVFFLAVLMMRSAMAQILQEIRDYDVDKQIERNTVVALGQKRGVRIVFTMNLMIFLSTLAIMVTNHFLDLGISMFYLIILFLSATHVPTFYKLLTTVDYKDSIERLWVGQGRTTRWTIVRYTVPCCLLFCIACFLAI